MLVYNPNQIFLSIFSLCFLFSPRCFGQLAAPQNLSISNISSFAFFVSFSTVTNATHYIIEVTPLHDESNRTKVNVSTNETTIDDLRSNTNYTVVVRAWSESREPGYMVDTTARTAPTGASILEAMTTPTSILVFLEPVPGATGWEVVAVDDASEFNQTVLVPEMTSSLYYVALFSNLPSNTRYSVKARVSQLNFKMNYTVDQSPFGNALTVVTNRISAFGRVLLITREFTTSSETNESLWEEISTELTNAYHSLSSAVYDVSVVKVVNLSGVILCHHEILFHSPLLVSFDVERLQLNDSKYEESKVALGAASEPGYIYSEEGVVSYGNRKGNCGGEAAEMEVDRRSVQLFGTDGKESVTLATNETSIIFGHPLERKEKSIFFGGEETSLSANTIYAMTYNFLTSNCPLDDATTMFFDRVYTVRKNNSSPNDIHSYAYLFTTGLGTKLPTDEISGQATAAGLKLRFPSALISRATSYQFASKRGPDFILGEGAVDGSEFYEVFLPGARYEHKIRMHVSVRNHDGGVNSASVNFSLTDDLDRRRNTGSTVRTYMWLLIGLFIGFMGLILFAFAVYKAMKVYEDDNEPNKKPVEGEMYVTNKFTLPIQGPDSGFDLNTWNASELEQSVEISDSIKVLTGDFNEKLATESIRDQESKNKENKQAKTIDTTEDS